MWEGLLALWVPDSMFVSQGDAPQSPAPHPGIMHRTTRIIQKTPEAGTSRKGQEAARSQVRALRSGKNGHSSEKGELHTEAGRDDKQQALGTSTQDVHP